MIRLSSYALATALLSRSVKAACPADDFTVSLAAGDACNYDNLVASLPAECTAAEIFQHPNGTALSEAEASLEVDDLCAYDALTQYVEIQGTYQLDRRYFQGGGPFVDGKDWNIDSGDVQRFEDNLGNKTVIAWPNYAARMEYNAENELGDNGYPTNMNLDKSCALQTAMCCFTDTHDEEFPSSTDVCRHDLSNSPQSNHIKYGWSVFPGAETPTYCVGMTWKDGEEELIGNAFYDISLRQTINHGYRAGVPGAPMCGCIEHMPVVEKADCRTATKVGEITYSFSVEYEVDEDGNALPPYVSASNSVEIEYKDCANTDLAGQFVDNGGDVKAIGEHLVGAIGETCADDLTEYLNNDQFLHEGQHPTKYLTPDPKNWTDLVVGEGIRFQPPAIEPEVADGNFRTMIDAGCTNEDGSARSCIIRRICDTCRTPSHRDIYYKRLTDLPPFGTNTTAGEKYLLDMFMNNFNNLENTFGPNGDETGDFQLFSTYEDAKAGTNPWTYCHFSSPGSNYGFPFECGPTGRTRNEWNSYNRGGAYAEHHGFYVEKPVVA